MKYKKAKRGAPRIIQEIARLKKEIENIESRPIITAAAPDDGPVIERPDKPLPFRTFTLPSGSIVHAGRSSRSNEVLTFKHTRPDDYFFHARGIEGAHVILKPKMPKAKNAKIRKCQKPRKEDIEAAASIAAFYSKAKKQKNVPVSYTQRKYLKKNKKGRAGSVIMMREEVIFVDPLDPAAASASMEGGETHG
jgi:predicted ribosome quality control (RQC) complex YloA/Tae2 family protein